MTTGTASQTFAEIFSDPYDVRASFQLSARTSAHERFNQIERIKDADAALHEGNYRTFLGLARGFLSFLDRRQRRQVLERIVYNHLYLRSFDPVIRRTALQTVEGHFAFGSRPSVHHELNVDLQKFGTALARESRKFFHALYGRDVSSSTFSMRYSHLEEPNTPTPSQIELAFKQTNKSFIHLDDRKGITTIAYLSEVDTFNGAFKYVEGSHSARMSPILKACHDFVHMDLHLRSPEQVTHLPPEFRAGPNYYFWLEPEKQQVIDSFTRSLVGPAGTAITFAGNRLLHGGGVPYSGERSALFVSHVGHVSQRLRPILHPLSVLGRLGWL